MSIPRSGLSPAPTRPRVVVLAGPPASGKTTVAQALAKFYAYKVCDVGVILANAVGEPPNDRSFIGPAFIDRFGVEGISKAITASLAPWLGAALVVDAVRFPQTAIELRANLERCSVWYVDCAREVRLERLHSRYAHLSAEARRARVAAYVQYDLQAQQLEPISDVKIPNHSSLENLHAAVDGLLRPSQ